MTQRANSHRNRKPWAARRLGALAVTLAALVTGSYVALPAHRPAPPLPARVIQVALPAPQPEQHDIDIALDLTEPEAPAPQRRRSPRTAAPVIAAVHIPHSGYDVLSAAELDAISQARN